MSADNGGPAFPTREKIGETFDDYTGKWHDEFGNFGGMTMRDYLAVNADVSRLEINASDVAEKLVGRPIPLDQVDAVKWQLELVAAVRYIAADAMLKERDK